MEIIPSAPAAPSAAGSPKRRTSLLSPLSSPSKSEQAGTSSPTSLKIPSQVSSPANSVQGSTPSTRTKRRSLGGSSKLTADAVTEAKELVSKCALTVAKSEHERQHERDMYIEELQSQQHAYKHALSEMDTEIARQRAELEKRNQEVATLREREAAAREKMVAVEEQEIRTSCKLEERERELVELQTREEVAIRKLSERDQEEETRTSAKLEEKDREIAAVREREAAVLDKLADADDAEVQRDMLADEVCRLRKALAIERAEREAQTIASRTWEYWWHSMFTSMLCVTR